MDNTALESRSSPSPDEDYLERSVRNRMLATSAILRSVAEHRMVEANKSRPQQVDEAKLTTGSQGDIYRAPDRKDVPGWKGSAELLKLDTETGGATIIYQGRPFLVPMRHIRQHIGLTLAHLTVMHAYLEKPSLGLGLTPESCTRRSTRASLPALERSATPRTIKVYCCWPRSPRSARCASQRC